MFGIVPRPLWERKIQPDARHRIRLAARSLLAIDRAAGRVVLVDAGMGERWDAKGRDVFDLRPAAIVKKFGLKNPIFEATASYGHFGNRPYTRKEKVWEDGREVEREIEFFGWEKLDAVDLIKQEFGL